MVRRSLFLRRSRLPSSNRVGREPVCVSVSLLPSVGRQDRSGQSSKRCSMIRLSMFFAVALLVSASFAQAVTVAAEVASVQCTIKSADPATRSVTVTYMVGTGEKSITLDVSRKAEITLNGEKSDLDSLASGLTATVDYNRELEIVTKIAAVGKLPNGWRFIDLEGKGTPTPDTALIVTKDDTLICTRDIGAWFLLSERRFPAMVFSIEYRYPKADRTGGAVVVATPGPSHGDYGMPFGFEIKLGAGKCGQMELPRGDYRVELPLGQIRDARRITQTRKKDPVVGQWNKLEIECSEQNNVVVKLNGEVVNAVAKAENVTGKIAIWPMNAEVHFRNPTVTIGGKEEKLEFAVSTGK